MKVPCTSNYIYILRILLKNNHLLIYTLYIIKFLLLYIKLYILVSVFSANILNTVVNFL